MKTYYESVAAKAKVAMENSPFWKELIGSLRDIEARYQVTHGYDLLMDTRPPTLIEKEYNSFLSKVCRKNVLENTFWPKEPMDGWITPDNWFSRVDDIVRTMFAVKYLDGVTFLVKAIETLCQKHSLTSKVDYEAKIEGYYAAHLYVLIRAENVSHADPIALY